MKINISAILFLVAWPGLLVAQTKLKVAYPTTIGAMRQVRFMKKLLVTG